MRCVLLWAVLVVLDTAGAQCPLYSPQVGVAATVVANRCTLSSSSPISLFGTISNSLQVTTVELLLDGVTINALLLVESPVLSLRNCTVVGHVDVRPPNTSGVSLVVQNSTFTSSGSISLNTSMVCSESRDCIPTINVTLVSSSLFNLSNPAIRILAQRTCEVSRTCAPKLRTLIRDTTSTAASLYYVNWNSSNPIIRLHADAMCPPGVPCAAYSQNSVIGVTVSRSPALIVTAEGICGASSQGTSERCDSSIELFVDSVIVQETVTPAFVLHTVGMCGYNQNSTKCSAKVLINVYNSTILTSKVELPPTEAVLLINVLGLCSFTNASRGTSLSAGSSLCNAEVAVIVDLLRMNTSRSGNNMLSLFGDGLCAQTSGKSLAATGSDSCSVKVLISVTRFTVDKAASYDRYRNALRIQATGICAFSIYNATSNRCNASIDVTMAVGALSNSLNELILVNIDSTCGYGYNSLISTDCAVNSSVLVKNISLQGCENDKYAEAHPFPTGSLQVILQSVCGFSRSMRSLRCNATSTLRFTFIEVNRFTAKYMSNSSIIVAMQHGLCGYGEDVVSTILCQARSIVTLDNINIRDTSLQYYFTGLLVYASELCGAGRKVTTSRCEATVSVTLLSVIYTNVTTVDSALVLSTGGACGGAAAVRDQQLSLGDVAISTACTASVVVKLDNVVANPIRGGVLQYPHNTTLVFISTTCSFSELLLRGADGRRLPTVDKTCPAFDGDNSTVFSKESRCGSMKVENDTIILEYTFPSPSEPIQIELWNQHGCPTIRAYALGEVGTVMLLESEVDDTKSFLAYFARPKFISVQIDGLCAKGTKATSTACAASCDIELQNIDVVADGPRPYEVLLSGMCAFGENAESVFCLAKSSFLLRNAHTRGELQYGGQVYVEGGCAQATASAFSASCRAGTVALLENVSCSDQSGSTACVLYSNWGYCASGVTESSSYSCMAEIELTARDISLKNYTDRVSIDSGDAFQFQLIGLCSSTAFDSGLPINSNSTDCRAKFNGNIYRIQTENTTTSRGLLSVGMRGICAFGGVAISANCSVTVTMSVHSFYILNAFSPLIPDSSPYDERGGFSWMGKGGCSLGAVSALSKDCSLDTQVTVANITLRDSRLPYHIIALFIPGSVCAKGQSATSYDCHARIAYSLKDYFIYNSSFMIASATEYTGACAYGDSTSFTYQVLAGGSKSDRFAPSDPKYQFSANDKASSYMCDVFVSLMIVNIVMDNMSNGNQIVYNEMKGLCGMSPMGVAYSYECLARASEDISNINAKSTANSYKAELSGYCAFGFRNTKSVNCRASMNITLKRFTIIYSSLDSIRLDVFGACAKTYEVNAAALSQNCHFNYKVNIDDVACAQHSQGVICVQVDGVCGESSTLDSIDCVATYNVSVSNVTIMDTTNHILSHIWLSVNRPCGLAGNVSAIRCAVDVNVSASDIHLENIMAHDMAFGAVQVEFVAICGGHDLEQFDLGNVTSSECEGTFRTRIDRIYVKNYQLMQLPMSSVFSLQVLGVCGVLKGPSFNLTTKNCRVKLDIAVTNVTILGGYFFGQPTDRYGLFSVLLSGVCGYSAGSVTSVDCSPNITLSQDGFTMNNVTSGTGLYGIDLNGICGYGNTRVTSVGCRATITTSLAHVSFSDCQMASGISITRIRAVGVCAYSQSVSATSTNCSASVSQKFTDVAGARLDSADNSVFLGIESFAMCGFAFADVVSESCSAKYLVQIIRFSLRTLNRITGSLFQMEGSCAFSANGNAKSLNCNATVTLDMEFINVTEIDAKDGSTVHSLGNRGLCAFTQSPFVSSVASSSACDATVNMWFHEIEVTNSRGQRGALYLTMTGACGEGTVVQSSNCTAETNFQTGSITATNCTGVSSIYTILYTRPCVNSRNCKPRGIFRMFYVEFKDVSSTIDGGAISVNLQSACVNTNAADCRSLVDFQIDGVKFTNCSSPNAGGALAVTASDPTGLRIDLVTLTVADCRASMGGAIFLRTLSEVQIRQSKFTGNTVSVPGWGGAIFTDDVLNLHAVEFDNNHGAVGAAIWSSRIISGTLINVKGSLTQGQGAIFASSVNLTSSIFTNNSASEGGAIWAKDSVFMSLSNFTNNKATAGGAIVASSFQCDGCAFDHNAADRGGAIVAAGAVVTRSTFTSNSAKSTGGALRVENLTVTSVRFAMNWAGFGGGSISCTSCLISRCEFYNSTASVAGGAVACAFGMLNISGSVFWNNSAKGRGGSIEVIDARPVSLVDVDDDHSESQLGGSIYSECPRVDIDHSTFRNCKAQGSGGCIYQIAHLDLRSSLFNGRAMGSGGGVFTRNLSCWNTTYSSCSAERGGGLYVSNGEGTLENSHFVACRAALGGGLAAGGAALVFRSVTFEDGNAIVGGDIIIWNSSVSLSGVSARNCSLDCTLDVPSGSPSTLTWTLFDEFALQCFGGSIVAIDSSVMSFLYDAHCDQDFASGLVNLFNSTLDLRGNITLGKPRGTSTPGGLLVLADHSTVRYTTSACIAGGPVVVQHPDPAMAYDLLCCGGLGWVRSFPAVVQGSMAVAAGTANGETYISNGSVSVFWNVVMNTHFQLYDSFNQTTVLRGGSFVVFGSTQWEEKARMEVNVDGTVTIKDAGYFKGNASLPRTVSQNSSMMVILTNSQGVSHRMQNLNLRFEECPAGFGVAPPPSPPRCDPCPISTYGWLGICHPCSNFMVCTESPTAMPEVSANVWLGPPVLEGPKRGEMTAVPCSILNLCLGTGRCAANRDPKSTMCSLCNPPYETDGSKCLVCSTSKWPVGVAVAVAFVAVKGALSVLGTLGKDTPHGTDDIRQATSAVATIGYAVPARFINDAVSIIFSSATDSLSWRSQYCFMKPPLLLAFHFPSLTFVALAVGMLPYYAYRKKYQDYINVLLYLTAAWFTSITEMLFRLLHCVPSGTGVSVISTQPTIECRGKDYTVTLVAVSLEALVGWLLYLGWLISIARKTRKSDSEFNRWPMLFLPYRLHHPSISTEFSALSRCLTTLQRVAPWWEIVEKMYQFLLVVLRVLIDRRESASNLEPLVAFVMACKWGLLIAVTPFRHSRGNLVAIASGLVSTVCVLAGPIDPLAMEFSLYLLISIHVVDIIGVRSFNIYHTIGKRRSRQEPHSTSDITGSGSSDFIQETSDRYWTFSEQSLYESYDSPLRKHDTD